jgi:hypothetical protein
MTRNAAKKKRWCGEPDRSTRQKKDLNELCSDERKKVQFMSGDYNAATP